MEYIGGSEEDTIFRLAEDDNNVIKLQKSEDHGEHWSVVSGSADIDLGAIEDSVAAEAARAQGAEEALSDSVAAIQVALDDLQAEEIGFSSQGSTMTSHDVQAAILEAWAAIGSGGTAAAVNVIKQQEAESGYAATYYVTQGGSQVGVKINIPKDFLVKSAELKTVEEEDVPYEGAHVGDKYIDFVVNAKDASAQEEHIYLPVNDLVDIYTAGKGIAINDSVISVDAATLDDGAIAQAKVNGLVSKLSDLDTEDARLAGLIEAEEDRAEAKEAELEAAIDELNAPKLPEFDEATNTLYANGNTIRITDDGTQNIAHYQIIDKGEQTLAFPYNGTVFAGGKGAADKFASFDMGEVVVDGGKFKSIYGGSELFGSVADTVLIFNGGTISSGIIGGGKAGVVGNVNQVGKAVVKFNGGEALTVYGGAHGHGNVAECELEFNGGHAQYVTVGGSNGLTGIGEAIINGGSIDVFQTVNRGYIEDAKVIVNGGTITKLYAGGETGDAGVTGKAEKVNLQLLGGTLDLQPGTYAGVEDASRCSGDYNTGVTTAAKAAACHLSENVLILNCNL